MKSLTRFASPVEAFYVSDPVDPDVGDRPGDDSVRAVTAGLVSFVASGSPAASLDV
ncbi:hypothetical protein FE840_000685 [Peteryoungia desertarenae]|uniref:Uncharacterized protein n=1 Tax=Peteryoungia desertarenae TaxID=1813451 RepID=A0ABX6QHZ8_9HYPH|nr:hypothetical protein [Peteryoungia desertarenae]QLF68194.1 hypothetical protein FE840_000685 [Peteryoungia desertarenae]